MRFSAGLNTVPANRATHATLKNPHLWGWVVCAIVVFAQSPGLTVADTKHDLVANPAGFLAGALHAWSDVFPLGQLQNQAYGYLFPQGLFFLITHPLPDWVAQRLWWLLVLGVGFSGFLRLTQRIAVGSPTFRLLAALLYVASPRALSTIGAISSETWPMMLTPWIMLPFLTPKQRAPIACSLLAVAALGAVNATATLAACLPTGILLLCTIRSRPGYTLPAWLAGCAAVSAWWIGPLLVLGRYAPPFTDYIENAWVTTRWLNPTEILRGTTSWTPFVDTERTTGFQLATDPVFVLITTAIAALGLAGLTLSGVRLRRFWILLACLGLLILCAAHGPFGEGVRAFLDGPGAALRNVHKFDPLVRLPLLVGFAAWGGVLKLPESWEEAAYPGRRHAAAILVVLVALTASAPLARLAPKGAYTQVTGYWHEAAQWLNNNAGDTRTLITPSAQFARQTWGWTRDEPLQPLLHVPWVVRDAIPLVGPESIRGLDGLMTVLDSDAVEPRAAFNAAKRFGVGVVVIRHDLTSGPAHNLTRRAREAGLKMHTFGEVDIVEIDLHAGRSTSNAPPVPVAGGGEALAMVDAISGGNASGYELVSSGARIVTDTPQLAARNYGAVSAAASAALADPAEGADVHNPVADYPSAGQVLPLEEFGGSVRASSSAADATSFGGVQSRRSVTAAVDDDPTTSWFPTPGTQDGQWIELSTDTPATEIELRITGGPVAITFTTDTASWSEWAEPHRNLRFRIPGGPSDRVRLTLGESTRAVGVSSFQLKGAEISRELMVPDTSPEVQQFLFQQLTSPTGLLARRFYTPREMSLRIDAPSCATTVRIDTQEASCGQTIKLSAGQHRLRTHADWVLLTEPGFEIGAAADAAGPDQDGESIIYSRRAANAGLRASVGGKELTPVTVDAGMQGFIGEPAGPGEFRMWFVGDRPYRLSLFSGLVVFVLVVGLCAVLARRGRVVVFSGQDCGRGWCLGIGIITIVLVGSWPGACAGVLGLLLGTVGARHWQRPSFLPTAVAAGGVGLAGVWLAHAPWPAANYAGDQGFVGWVCLAALGAVLGRCGLRAAD